MHREEADRSPRDRGVEPRGDRPCRRRRQGAPLVSNHSFSRVGDPAQSTCTSYERHSSHSYPSGIEFDILLVRSMRFSWLGRVAAITPNVRLPVLKSELQATAGAVVIASVV